MIDYMAPIYDDIRKAIEASEMSRYRMSKETGISESQLSLFMSRERGLSVDKLELLAACMGLEVTVRPIKPQRRKARGN